MTRPVIYIAGPYTAGDPAANVHRAVNIAHYLMDHGLAWPLVPHLSHLWHLIAPRPYALDFALLERCDGLIRLPGVSTGADGETDWCTDRGCGQLLLSLHGWRFTAVGCSPAQWADPDCNVKAMLHLYREAGTSPWSL